jgi:hypothetical protein
MTGSPPIRATYRPGLHHTRPDVQAGAQVQERLPAGFCGWEDLGDLDRTKGTIEATLCRQDWASSSPGFQHHRIRIKSV